MAEAAGLRVQVGETVVDGADPAALERAVAAHNRSVAIEGLDPVMNPAAIDLGKARALLAALPKEKFGRHRFLLTGPGLLLAPGSPSTAGSFAGVRVLSTDLQGDVVLAKLSTAPDCGLAARQAAAARAAFQASAAEADALDGARRTQSGAAEGETVGRLVAVQRRRSAMAGTWRENARAAAACAPGDAGAKADAEAATAALRQAGVPSGPGMR